ncbi:MAG: hypothetical protein U9O94_03635 [Nanoarchaeota archaeon]|nr:hypothetical protein [Nanoarchaeota archaeon]
MRSNLELLAGAGIIAAGTFFVVGDANAKPVDPKLKDEDNAFIQSATGYTPEFSLQMSHQLEYLLTRVELDGLAKPDQTVVSEEGKISQIESDFKDKPALMRAIKRFVLEGNDQVYIFYLDGNTPSTEFDNVLLAEIQIDGMPGYQLKRAIKDGFKPSEDQGILDLRTVAALSNGNYFPLSKDHLKIVLSKYVNPIDHVLTAASKWERSSKPIASDLFEGYSSSLDGRRRIENVHLLDQYLRETCGDQRVMSTQVSYSLAVKLGLDNWINDVVDIASVIKNGSRVYFFNDGDDLVAARNSDGSGIIGGRYAGFSQKVAELVTKGKEAIEKRKNDTTKDRMIALQDAQGELVIVPYSEIKHMPLEGEVYRVHKDVRSKVRKLGQRATALDNSTKLSEDGRGIYGIVRSDVDSWVAMLTESYETNLKSVEDYQTSIDTLKVWVSELLDADQKLIEPILIRYQKTIDLAKKSVNEVITVQEKKAFEDLDDVMEFAETNTLIDQVDARLPEDTLKVRRYRTFIIDRKYDQAFYIEGGKVDNPQDDHFGGVTLGFNETSGGQKLVDSRRDILRRYILDMGAWHNEDLLNYAIEIGHVNDILGNLGNGVSTEDSRTDSLDNVVIFRDSNEKRMDAKYVALKTDASGRPISTEGMTEEQVDKEYPTRNMAELIAARDEANEAAKPDTALINKLARLTAQVKADSASIFTADSLNTKLKEKLEADAGRYEGLVDELQAKVDEYENKGQWVARFAAGVGIRVSKDDVRRTAGANVMFKRVKKEYERIWERFGYGAGIEITLANPRGSKDPEVVTLSNGKQRVTDGDYHRNLGVLVTPIFSVAYNEKFDFILRGNIGVNIGTDESNTTRFVNLNGNSTKPTTDNYGGKGQTRFGVGFGFNYGFDRRLPVIGAKGIQGSLDIGSDGKKYLGCKLRF